MEAYLSCEQIYNALKRAGVRQTNELKYAYEFELINIQVIYIKRLLDGNTVKDEPFRLMIHPALLALKSELQAIKDVDFSFSTKGNMSTAFARYPKCPASECTKNPSNYGIGVNFKSEKGLKVLIDFLSKL